MTDQMDPSEAADQRREEAWRREKEGNVLMGRSDKIDLLAKALSAAQGKFTPVVKDKVNPYFGSRYASLDSIMDMCRPHLAAEGLAVTQLARIPHLNEEREGVSMVLETVLMHSSGQFVSSVWPLRPDLRDKPAEDGQRAKRANTDQRVMSSVTYAKRGGVSAILGIVSDEDDDAESSGPPRNGRQAAPESMEAAKAQLRADPRSSEEIAKLVLDPIEVGRAKMMADEFVRELGAPGVDLVAWKKKNKEAMAALGKVDEAAWQRVVDAGNAAAEAQKRAKAKDAKTSGFASEQGQD